MREYMNRLRARGDLLEVHREVSPKHELAAVTQEAQRRYGKPVLFHKVAGTSLPVLTNIYGARERLAEILGIGPNDFCRQWSSLANLAACALYLYVAIGPVYGASGGVRVVQAIVLALAVGAIVLGYRFVLFLITLYAA